MTTRQRPGRNRVYINGAKIKNRLVELGMSERSLALASGVTVAGVRSAINEDAIPSQATIGNLDRLLNELGFDPGELLDPEPIEPDDDHDSDVQLLAQVLIRDPQVQRSDRLAIALEWTLDRVAAAQHALDDAVRPLGLKVHMNASKMTVRHLDSRSDRAMATLADLRDDAQTLHPNTARALYTAYTGALDSLTLKAVQQLQFGALRNRGAVVYGQRRGKRITLHEDTRFAFDVADDPQNLDDIHATDG